MYSLTLFKNTFDNTTNKRMDFTSWEKFEELLYNISKLDGFKPSRDGLKAGEKSSPLISPAIYNTGTKRANANVTEWARWAAIDVDNHTFKGNLKDELHSRFGNWYYVCYSTASSTIDTPKFRLVFPLTSTVPASKIRHFWWALNSEFDSIGDRQTKDLSRMYYVPAQYSGANNFIFSNSGNHIDPYSLMEKHPFVEKSTEGFMDKLPKAIRDAIMKEKLSKLTNCDITWTSYHNCPFVHPAAVKDYHAITQTGWYHGLYRLMVSIASSAIKRGYPITESEISVLCRQIDADSGGWYKTRPIEKEAKRALDWVLKNDL